MRTYHWGNWSFDELADAVVRAFGPSHERRPAVKAA